MKCCTRSRVYANKEKIVSKDEVTALLTTHKDSYKIEEKKAAERRWKICKSCGSCCCASFIFLFILASLTALRQGTERAGVTDLVPSQSQKNLVYLASLELDIAVQTKQISDLSGIWWWRKVEELAPPGEDNWFLRVFDFFGLLTPPANDFFMPLERELGLSFANITCPAGQAGYISFRPNSMHNIFFTEANFWWWLYTLITGTLIDGAKMGDALKANPIEEVGFKFSSALDSIQVTQSSGKSFYLVKVDDNQWLQTTGITGYSTANVTNWALDLSPYGVETSGYILTRIVNGGIGTPNADWWSTFTERISPQNKTTIITWDTNNRDRRWWSQYISWAYGSSKALFAEPDPPYVPEADRCQVYTTTTLAPPTTTLGTTTTAKTTTTTTFNAFV
jgi:hypothetical protein